MKDQEAPVNFDDTGIPLPPQRTVDHDALREEWSKQAPENHNSIMKRLHEVTADWWIAKLEAQSARHREELLDMRNHYDWVAKDWNDRRTNELEGIAKEIVAQSIEWKVSENMELGIPYNNAMRRATAIVRSRITGDNGNKL